MTAELFRHAERVLEYAPTRSMPADLLRDRLRADSGIVIGTRALLDAVAGSPRFAVLPPPLSPRSESGWRVAERAVYERALCAARLDVPWVSLAGVDAGDAAAAIPLPAAPATGAAALLADAHEAVSALLGTHAGDPAFRAELAGAMAQLDAARRVLDPG